MSMITPVSAATPARAMKPTATAIDRLKPSHHSNHRPPTSEDGSDSTTISVSGRDQGKRHEARELLAPVYGWFTERFDMCDLREAKALVDELAA
jgi:hypothetical protein